MYMFSIYDHNTYSCYIFKINILYILILLKFTCIRHNGKMWRLETADLCIFRSPQIVEARDH